MTLEHIGEFHPRRKCLFPEMETFNLKKRKLMNLSFGPFAVQHFRIILTRMFNKLECLTLYNFSTLV